MEFWKMNGAGNDFIVIDNRPLHYSQQQLADLVSVSRQTINAIEKGDYNPTIRLCISICRALGKTLDELFWEEEEQ